jgi:hypothetical protein
MSIEDEMIEDEARRRGLSATQLGMLKATPDRLMRDLTADARRASPMQPSSPIARDAEPAPARGNGWQESLSLEPQPGIDLIDRMCLAQDARDRSRR